MSRSFRYLFWIQFLGSFVDNFIKSFLVVLVVYKSITLMGMDEAKLVPMAGLLFVLPYFLFSTLAGTVASKYQRKILIQYIKLFELSLVIIALAFYFLECWIGLFGIVFLQGTQSTFFGPIKYSIIPDYVKSEKLLKANGWVELGTFISILIGTIMGTRSITFVMENPSIFYALLVLPSVVGYLLSLKLAEVEIENPKAIIHFNIITNTLEEMKTFFHRKEIFRDIQCISFFWFNGIWVMSILPLMTKKLWGGPEVLLTYFLSIFTIGIGLGSMACYKFQSKIQPVKWSIKNLILMVGLFFVLGLTTKYYQPYETLSQWVMVPQHMFISICLFLFSLIMGLYIVPLYTNLQMDAPLMLRSKAIANNNIYNAFYMMLASVIFMSLTDLLAYRHFFWALGLINFGFLLFLLPKKS